MPDFTVIDGGGGGEKPSAKKPEPEPDYSAEEAQARFEQLVVEIIRTLVRSDEFSYEVVRKLISFYEADSEAELPTGAIIEKAIASLRGGLDEKRWGSLRETELLIVTTSLQLAAEFLSTDGFARGRASKRESSLRLAIEEWIVQHERRSRENGWSFTGHLLSKRLGSWKPVTLTRAKAKRKKAKKAAPEKIIDG